MSITLSTAPPVCPVTIDEVKEQRVIEHNDDDVLLGGFIEAATEYVEHRTGLNFVQRTWDYKVSSFTSEIELPFNPVQSVSITYTDKTLSPEIQTVSTDVYEVDTGVYPPVVRLKYGQSWPSYTSVKNGITLQVVAGYAPLGSPENYRGNIPELVKTAIKILVGGMDVARESKSDLQFYDTDIVDGLLQSIRVYK